MCASARTTIEPSHPKMQQNEVSCEKLHKTPLRSVRGGPTTHIVYVHHFLKCGFNHLLLTSKSHRSPQLWELASPGSVKPWHPGWVKRHPFDSKYHPRLSFWIAMVLKPRYCNISVSYDTSFENFQSTHTIHDQPWNDSLGWINVINLQIDNTTAAKIFHQLRWRSHRGC